MRCEAETGSETDWSKSGRAFRLSLNTRHGNLARLSEARSSNRDLVRVFEGLFQHAALHMRWNRQTHQMKNRGREIQVRAFLQLATTSYPRPAQDDEADGVVASLLGGWILYHAQFAQREAACSRLGETARGVELKWFEVI